MVCIREVIVESKAVEHCLFVDRLVRNLLEDREIIDGADSELHFLLCFCAFRVNYLERCDSGAVPVWVWNLNLGDMLFVDIHKERTSRMFLADALHFDFPGKFFLFVVIILDKIVEVNLCELILFVNRLSRDLLHELRNVIHRFDSEVCLSLSTCTFWIRDLEVDRFGAIPKSIRNQNLCILTCKLDLEILIAREFPLQLFELVVDILDILAKIDRLELLLFHDRLVWNHIDEFRSIVHRLHRERSLEACRSTLRIGCLEFERFGRAIPVFVRNDDFSHVVLIDLDLEFLTARNRPLDL